MRFPVVLGPVARFPQNQIDASLPLSQVKDKFFYSCQKLVFDPFEHEAVGRHELQLSVGQFCLQRCDPGAELLF